MNIIKIFIWSNCISIYAKNLSFFFCELAKLHCKCVLQLEFGDVDLVRDFLAYFAIDWNPHEFWFFYDFLMIILFCLEPFLIMEHNYEFSA